MFKLDLKNNKLNSTNDKENRLEIFAIINRK